MVAAKKVFFLILLILTGCAPSYVKKSAPVLDGLSREDYEEALAALERLKNEPFLYLVEKGTILHYAEKYEESNEAFREAEQLREELIVPSITEGTISLLTSDVVRSYAGEDYEDIFINYFSILNYLFLDEYEEALVEARKVDIKLKVLEELYEGTLTHKNDAFMRYLTGVLYELEGSYNDAFIAYEKSYNAYAEYGELYGMDGPDFLRSDLVRTALWSNLFEEAEYYRELFPELDDRSFPSGGFGELLCIFENGLLPHKEEKIIEAPIPHDDEVYLLKIAFPVIGRKEAFFSRARVRVGDLRKESSIVEDLHAIAIQNLKDRELREIARAATRTALKYVITQQSRKVGEKLGKEKNDTTSTERSKALGWLFGSIANLFGYATEHADLRSWRSLPQNIQLLRLELPEGSYDVQVQLLDRKGRVARTISYSQVSVKEGEISFLRYRSY